MIFKGAALSQEEGVSESCSLAKKCPTSIDKNVLANLGATLGSHSSQNPLHSGGWPSAGVGSVMIERNAGLFGSKIFPLCTPA